MIKNKIIKILILIGCIIFIIGALLSSFFHNTEYAPIFYFIFGILLLVLFGFSGFLYAKLIKEHNPKRSKNTTLYVIFLSLLAIIRLIFYIISFLMR